MNKLGHVFRCINALNMLRHLLDTCLHLNMYTDTIDTIQLKMFKRYLKVSISLFNTNTYLDEITLRC